MTITITLPPQFKPENVQLELSVNQLSFSSPYGGSETPIDKLNDRWKLDCTIPLAPTGEGGWREAFIGNLRGNVNVVPLYHFARQLPAGTARGTMTLNAAAAQGAGVIVVTGVSPATGTLLAGDMLGVGGMLLMVGSDCSASAGVITIPVTNKLRMALSSGAVVTWYRPTCLFRALSVTVPQYTPGIVQPITFQFGEAI